MSRREVSPIESRFQCAILRLLHTHAEVLIPIPTAAHRAIGVEFSNQCTNWLTFATLCTNRTVHHSATTTKAMLQEPFVTGRRHCQRHAKLYARRAVR